MSVKTKLLVYIVVIALLAIIGAALGFWFYNNSSFASLPSFVKETSQEESQMHRAYSMDEGFYSVFFANNKQTKNIEEKVVSAVVPHHLIAGQFIGSFFNSMAEQKPDTVVIIGPNHKQVGNSSVITSNLSWQTPYGTLNTNKKLINKIIAANIASSHQEVMGDEHSISSLVPFVKKTWPKATVVPIILKNNAKTEDVDRLVETLSGSEEKIIVLASVDFSHYLPQSVADFHDALSINTLESGSFQNLRELEVDSQPSLYALLKYNEYKKSQAFTLLSHTNSGEIIGKDISDTTSHIIGYYTDGTPGKKPAASVQFFGDIMLDREVAKVMGKTGLHYIFKNLRAEEDRFFQGIHMLVANLEGPFAPARVSTTKSIAFRFDPKLAAELKSYGFDAFSLANNHSMDMGRKNVEFTRGVLNQNGFGYFGDEYNQGLEYSYIAGEEKNLPFNIAFVGLNFTEGPLDMVKVKEAIDDAKSKAKFVIINIHWGEEYKRNSNKSQQDLAHQLIDWGADVIIGHHPHVVQEIEIYKDKYIFYSLGNFIFDQYFSRDTQEGMSVGLILEDSGRVKVHIIPFFSKRSQVQVMTGEQKEEFFKWMKENSRMGSSSFEF